MKAYVIAIVLGVALVSTAQAAILGTVNIQNHNTRYSEQARLWGGGLTGGTYYTGIYSWTNDGGTDLGQFVPDWGFCIELTQPPVNGWQDIIPLDEAPLPVQPIYGTPMGPVKADYIRELWGRFFDPAWISGADKEMAEAFNIAIWEIIYETDSVWDVTSGAGFRAADVQQAALANYWLSQLDGDSAYFENNLVATNDGQDYLVLIPEPITIAYLSIGIALILRRRK